MRILAWHVHGSWMTSFVSGRHDYVIPLTPDRDADGRGRALTWDWPARAREVPVADLRDEPFDVAVLQRPHEAELLEQWTCLRAGSPPSAIAPAGSRPRRRGGRACGPVWTYLPSTSSTTLRRELRWAPGTR